MTASPAADLDLDIDLEPPALEEAITPETASSSEAEPESETEAAAPEEDLRQLAREERDAEPAAAPEEAAPAEEAEPAVGVGAEVMAIINEECFFELDAAPQRVSAVHVPIPYNRSLEKAAIPNANDVVMAVRKMFAK